MNQYQFEIAKKYKHKEVTDMKKFEKNGRKGKFKFFVTAYDSKDIEELRFIKSAYAKMGIKDLKIKECGHGVFAISSNKGLEDREGAWRMLFVKYMSLAKSVVRVDEEHAYVRLVVDNKKPNVRVRTNRPLAVAA